MGVKTAENLAVARVFLQEVPWGKATLFNDSTGEMCALGGVCAALGVQPDTDAYGEIARRPEVETLAKVIRARGRVVAETDLDTVWAYNDFKAAGVQDVLSLFDPAVELALADSSTP